MLGFPPTASSCHTGPRVVSVLPLFLLPFSSSFSLPSWFFGGMSILRVITHSSCGECICDVSAHPLGASRTPWVAMETSSQWDSLSWLGVVKPVKRNRWETVALTWSFCPCYLRNSDLIFSWVGLRVYSCNYMLISVVNVINTYMSCNLLIFSRKIRQRIIT